MTRCEFIFEAPHPHDPDILLRFIISAPVPFAHRIPKGSILETYINWRGNGRG